MTFGNMFDEKGLATKWLKYKISTLIFFQELMAKGYRIFDSIQLSSFKTILTSILILKKLREIYCGRLSSRKWILLEINLINRLHNLIGYRPNHFGNKSNLHKRND